MGGCKVGFLDGWTLEWTYRGNGQGKEMDWHNLPISEPIRKGFIFPIWSRFDQIGQKKPFLIGSGILRCRYFKSNHIQLPTDHTSLCSFNSVLIHFDPYSLIATFTRFRVRSSLYSRISVFTHSCVHSSLCSSSPVIDYLWSSSISAFIHLCAHSYLFRPLCTQASTCPFIQ
jgi:hypothetical protein